ncbi:transposase, partial [Pseudoalteromonas sp. GABNS16H]|nr:transposase [Pseudoalteromonas sp. GABNS16H]
MTSTSGNLNFGPGARYEIDATIADLYLVAEDDPAPIIGRPVLYFVKDVFSRMVVGMYVGLENPSWVAAMVALSNAFSDKTTYCQG